MANIIIADTNVAYVLYFFLDKGLIPTTDIKIQSGHGIKFHPIVKVEVNAHFNAWSYLQGRGIKRSPFPVFFDTIREEGIRKVVKFVEDNTDTQIASVNISSADYQSKRKVYEAERKRLQKEWGDSGVKGKKVTSMPSNNDYSILYSAEKNACALATNDEILLSISESFLDEDDLFRAEDIISVICSGDSQKIKLVEEISEVLAMLKLPFVLSRAIEQESK